MDRHYFLYCWMILVPGILYASWVDGKQRRVPNWLNAVLLASGLLLQGVCFGWGDSEFGVQAGLLGALVGFGVLIIPWLMYGMGAGDVKLMAAIGAWIGPSLTWWSFVGGAILGGLIAVVMILRERKLSQACANMNAIMIKMSNPAFWFTDYAGAKTFGSTSQLLPYGIPLTIGTIGVLTWHTWGLWSF